jgi:DNA (cytosine-5)-methyltransferase 1
MTWTHLDTFSGIGGFALAAAWTGRIQTVQFVEIDPWCRRVLAKHWPGVPIHDDIRTFLADTSLADGRVESAISGQTACDGWANEAARGGSGTLDLLTGGFPCQPFSAAGKRQSESDDRYLWPELARVIRCTRPRYCLLENVPGIIGLAGGLDRVLADLEASGYATGTVVIPAAAVGAYHRRDRVWIVATRDTDGEQQGALCGILGGAHAEPARDREAGAANAIRERLEGQQPGGAATGTVERSRGGTEALSTLGLCAHGLPTGVLGRPAFGPDWEAGIPRVTQHEADRVNKLKALGNAIVPQVAYELMLMLLAVDDEGGQ